MCICECVYICVYVYISVCVNIELISEWLLRRNDENHDETTKSIKREKRGVRGRRRERVGCCERKKELK